MYTDNSQPLLNLDLNQAFTQNREIMQREMFTE